MPDKHEGLFQPWAFEMVNSPQAELCNQQGSEKKEYALEIGTSLSNNLWYHLLSQHHLLFQYTTVQGVVLYCGSLPPMG